MNAVPRKKRTLKRPLKALLLVLLAILLAGAGYVAYAELRYYRLPDFLPLDVTSGADENLHTGQSVNVLSWNIGFGAYESDFGFFLDGGDRSWAWSRERLNANLEQITGEVNLLRPDLLLLQEVDVDATRSYHINELEQITAGLDRACDRIFAQNYDSPFLCYPFLQPHGSTRAGMLTASAYPVSSALRRSLPVEQGFTRFLDLDRCYSVCRVPVAEGGELVLYNLHLSAYTSDGTIAVEQLELLLSDMEAEYRQGNYCIAGGDFNKDLLGNSEHWFGAADQSYNWAMPIPPETFADCHMTLVPPLDEAHPVPSCRNADGPYHPGQYVLTVDGFLVSDNVRVVGCGVTDTGFQYSDHNPVWLTAELLPPSPERG